MEQLVSKKDVAAMLKDARAACKMSVEEVAAALKSYGYEIMPKSLYNYETGTSAPAAAMFLVLCKIYGIEQPAQYFAGGFVRKVEVTQREETLLDYFRAASPELQDAALRMLTPAEKDSTSFKVG